jgi:hypothetical protein
VILKAGCLALFGSARVKNTDGWWLERRRLEKATHVHLVVHMPSAQGLAPCIHLSISWASLPACLGIRSLKLSEVMGRCTTAARSGHLACFAMPRM